MNKNLLVLYLPHRASPIVLYILGHPGGASLSLGEDCIDREWDWYWTRRGNGCQVFVGVIRHARVVSSWPYLVFGRRHRTHFAGQIKQSVLHFIAVLNNAISQYSCPWRGRHQIECVLPKIRDQRLIVRAEQDAEPRLSWSTPPENWSGSGFNLVKKACAQESFYALWAIYSLIQLPFGFGVVSLNPIRRLGARGQR